MTSERGLRVLLGEDDKDGTRAVTLKDFRAHQLQNNRMQIFGIAISAAISIFFAWHYNRGSR